MACDLQTSPGVILLASNRSATRDCVTRMIGGLSFTSAIDVPGCLAVLQSEQISVVVCDADLPGGGWKEILEVVQSLTDAPLLVVTAPHADSSLWAEVLNLGGYDVLAQPFHADEVRRILWRGAGAQTVSAAAG